MLIKHWIDRLTSALRKVEEQQAERERQSKGPLIALIGVAAAAILVPTVAMWEGKENTAYADLVGRITICYGDTYDVSLGDTATDEECRERLERQLVAHTEPVLECVPNLDPEEKPNLTAAAASLAYNIGVNGFCRSTAARRFRAGDWRGGCDAMLMWNKAGGRVVRGLVNRRRAEHAICIRDA